MKTTMFTTLLILLAVSTTLLAGGNNNGSGSCEASNGNSNRCGGGDTYITNNTYVTRNVTKKFITRNVDRSTNITEEHTHVTNNITVEDVIAKRVGAMSAALNAMPFKDDSVAVGLGQYRGTSAVAIGLQKRLSERTTARVNASATEGDLSFGVGVGYEF